MKRKSLQSMISTLNSNETNNSNSYTVQAMNTSSNSLNDLKQKFEPRPSHPPAQTQQQQATNPSRLSNLNINETPPTNSSAPNINGSQPLSFSSSSSLSNFSLSPSSSSSCSSSITTTTTNNIGSSIPFQYILRNPRNAPSSLITPTSPSSSQTSVVKRIVESTNNTNNNNSARLSLNYPSEISDPAPSSKLNGLYIKCDVVSTLAKKQASPSSRASLQPHQESSSNKTPSVSPRPSQSKLQTSASFKLTENASKKLSKTSSNAGNWVPVKHHSAKCNIMLRKTRRGYKRSKSLPPKFSIDSLLDYLNCSMILNKYELKKLNQQRSMMLNSSASNNNMNYNASLSNFKANLNTCNSFSRNFNRNLNLHTQFSSGYNSENYSNSSNSTSTTNTNYQLNSAVSFLNSNLNSNILNFYRLSLSHLPLHFVSAQCTCGASNRINCELSPLSNSRLRSTKHLASSPILKSNNIESMHYRF